jgi:hypothetical protein
MESSFLRRPDNINVDEVFMDVAKDIVQRYVRGCGL